MDTLWRDKLKHREISETISKTVNEMTRGSIQEILEVEEEARTTSSLDDQNSVRNKLFPNDSIRESEYVNHVTELPNSIYSNQELGSERTAQAEESLRKRQKKISSFDYFVEEEVGPESRKSSAKISAKQIRSLDMQNKSDQFHLQPKLSKKKEKLHQSGKDGPAQEGFSKIKISFLSQEENEAQRDKLSVQQSQPVHSHKLNENLILVETWAHAEDRPGFSDPVFGEKEALVNERKLETSEIVEDFDNEIDQNCFIKLMTNNNVEFEESPSSQEAPENLGLLDSPPTVKLESSFKQRNPLYEERVLAQSRTVGDSNYIEIPKIKISGSENNEEVDLEFDNSNLKSRSADPTKIKHCLKNLSNDLQEQKRERPRRQEARQTQEDADQVWLGSFENQIEFKNQKETSDNEQLSHSFSQLKKDRNDLEKLNQEVIFQKKEELETKKAENDKHTKDMLYTMSESSGQRSGPNQNGPNDTVKTHFRNIKIKKSQKIQTDIPKDKIKKLFELKRNTLTRKTKSKKLNFYSSFQIKKRTPNQKHFRGKTFIRRKSESQKLKNIQSLRFYPNLKKSLSPNHSKFFREAETRPAKEPGRLKLDTKFGGGLHSKSKMKVYHRTCKNGQPKKNTRLTNRSQNSHSYDFLSKTKSRQIFSEVNNYFDGGCQEIKSKETNSVHMNSLARDSRDKDLETGKKEHIDEYNLAPQNLRVSISLDQKANRPVDQKNNLFKTINITPNACSIASNKSFESFMRKKGGKSKNLVSVKKYSEESLLKNYQSAHNIIKANGSEYYRKLEKLMLSSKKKRPGRGDLQPSKHLSFKKGAKKKKNLSKDLKLKTTFNTFKKQFKQEFYKGNKANGVNLIQYKQKKRHGHFQNHSRDIDRIKTDL